MPISPEQRADVLCGRVDRLDRLDRLSRSVALIARITAVAMRSTAP
jgi:hypothetical protein